MKNKNLLIALVILICVGFATYFLLNTNKVNIETVSKGELKTYSNQKYGFDLNYPNNYKINEVNYEQEEQPGGVVYLVQLGDETVIDFNKDFDKGIMIYVVKNDTNSLVPPSGSEPVSQKDTIIGDQKAVEYSYNGGYNTYTVAKNGYEYQLILGSQANQTTKNDFEKMVSSLKFTK